MCLERATDIGELTAIGDAIKILRNRNGFHKPGWKVDAISKATHLGRKEIKSRKLVRRWTCVFLY